MLRKFIYALSAYYTCASDPAPNTEGSQVLECKKGEPCWDFFKAAFEMAKKQPRSRSSGSLDPNSLVLNNFRSEFLIPMFKNEGYGLNQEREGMQSRSSSGHDIRPFDRKELEEHIWYALGNYGCWCPRFDDSLEILWPSNVAGSEPVDEYDRACKTHVMNSKCITIDAEYEDRECDPESEDYDATFTIHAVDPIMTYECTNTLEDDWCKRRTCLVDLNYIFEYMRLLTSGTYPKNEYFHYKRTSYQYTIFDPTSQCSNFDQGHGPVDTEGLKCCGDYPDRTLYNPLDTNNQCCVYLASNSLQVNNDNVHFPKNIGKMYNPNKQICTDFGVHDENAEH